MSKHALIQPIASTLLGLALLCPLPPALAAETPVTAHAVYWQGDVVADGHLVGFAQNGQTYEPINCGGSIYVPLFAVGEWTASSVQWDKNAGQISVHYDHFQPTYYRSIYDMPYGEGDAAHAAWSEKVTSGRTAGFDVTVLTGTTVTGDRGAVTATTAQGEHLYPIVYEDIPYLPVRTVAQLTGKALCYFNQLNKRPYDSVYLYEKPSREQIQAAYAYLEDVSARIQAVDAYTATVAQAQTIPQLHDSLVALEARLLRVKDPFIPSISPLTEEVLNNLYRYGVDGDNGLLALTPDIAWSAQPNPSGKEMWRVRDLHAENIHVLCLTLTNDVTRMRQIVDGMAAGELR